MVDRSCDQPTMEKSFAQNHFTMVDWSCDQNISRDKEDGRNSAIEHQKDTNSVGLNQRYQSSRVLFGYESSLHTEQTQIHRLLKRDICKIIYVPIL